MAVQILLQPKAFPAPENPSLAELALLYGERVVAEVQTRLQVVLEFKSLKPKTILSSGRPIPSPIVEELARKAGVSLGTLRRWYYLYRSAYASAQGNVHVKAKAGFEALIPRPRGRTADPSSDKRYKVDEELRRAIAGLYTRRKRPSIAREKS